MSIDIRQFKNLISENCSIYALTSGAIVFQDFYNESWSQNYTDSFLPAYYLTNCSIADLKEISSLDNLHSSNLTELEYGSHYRTYDKTDNGDSFVALLFTISGTCVACWMLTLLMYLSPKHKRKSWLTQLATVFYSILATIILSNITDTSKTQYYKDSLDLIELHHLVYVSYSYRIMLVFSQLFTSLAWLQIVAHVSKLKFKWYSILVNLILILVYTVVHSIYQVKYNNHELIFYSGFDSPYQRWRFALSILKLLIVIWLGASILYYTTVIKNPRKICYSKKLFPLAFSSLSLFVIHIVINIFLISLFFNDWQVRSWMTLISSLIEIGMLTAIWEWIYGIEFLEKRYEIMGMLGRRISLNDVISFNLYGNHERPEKPDKLKQLIDFLMRKIFRNKYFDHLAYEEDVNNKDTIDSLPGPESGLLLPQNLDSTEAEIPNNSSTNFDNINYVHNYEQNMEDRDIIDTHSNQSSGSYEDEYIDDYQFSDEEHNTTASNTDRRIDHPQSDPPSFVPLPGFSRDDYWPDEK
mmetsp:Transcript_2575/g.2512  ORF Transcript_2575/g.2512 Transcript_2575/m.2512 type:complete len:525 (+) Transcript_2575:70-1644(+)